MDKEHEHAEIKAVEALLGERFPQLDPEVVEAAVRMAHSELTGGIRDFVPVLVEHTAPIGCRRSQTASQHARLTCRPAARRRRAARAVQGLVLRHQAQQVTSSRPRDRHAVFSAL
jgi:hypothetical protein